MTYTPPDDFEQFVIDALAAEKASPKEVTDKVKELLDNDYKHRAELTKKTWESFIGTYKG